MIQTNHAVQPLDIKIGSTVQCLDGRAGRVIKVVVEPGSKRVTHIVVERGMLLHHDVIVPVTRIARVRGDTVELDMSIDDLKAQPEYAEIDYAAPDPAWCARHGYPPESTLIDVRLSMPSSGLLVPAWSGAVVLQHIRMGLTEAEKPIGRGTRLTCRDGSLGRLDHVLLDPETDAVQALVVRKGRLLTKDVIVPISWVESIEEDEIILGADRALLEKLPEYHPDRTDAQITADVQQALAADGRTRGQHIGVQAGEGVVHLRGVVPAEETKRAATEVAGRVPGVWEVERHSLLAENDVAAAVGEALAHDPRTSQAAIDVSYQGGSVTLSGRVRTAAEKAAAVEMARGIPGVVAVIDELEIRSDAARKRWPAMAAANPFAAARL